ncbi:MAG: hypothetical protein KDB27_22110 [Planctomycetales bacterium]|nr:hypothetical protein [Planctomycetales bacterium]
MNTHPKDQPAPNSVSMNSPAPHEPDRTRTSIASRRRHANSLRRRNRTGPILTVTCLVVLLGVLVFVNSMRKRTPSGGEGKSQTQASEHPQQSLPQSRNLTGQPDAQVQSTDVETRAAKSIASDTVTENAQADEAAISEIAQDDSAGLVGDDRVRFDELLQSARRATDSKQFSLAEHSLIAARNMANSESEFAQVERIAEFSQYVAEFWRAFDESLQDLEGTEIQHDGRRMMVVSVRQEGITIRDQGQNHGYAFDELSPEMVLTIANRRFSQTASSDVFRGAYMATVPEFGELKARQLWRNARSAGVEFGDLERLLEEQ